LPAHPAETADHQEVPEPSYSAMLGAVGPALNQPTPRRPVRWLTGTILVGLGARVALNRA